MFPPSLFVRSLNSSRALNEDAKVSRFSWFYETVDDFSDETLIRSAIAKLLSKAKPEIEKMERACKKAFGV
jgi:hypothetical protein